MEVCTSYKVRLGTSHPCVFQVLSDERPPATATPRKPIVPSLAPGQLVFPEHQCMHGSTEPGGPARLDDWTRWMGTWGGRWTFFVHQFSVVTNHGSPICPGAGNGVEGVRAEPHTILDPMGYVPSAHPSIRPSATTKRAHGLSGCTQIGGSRPFSPFPT